MTLYPPTYSLALEDFQRARRKAAMEQLLARFSGRSTDLLSYEELRQQLRVVNQTPRGLQEIPLDKIVGSVGRYKDFNRSFLPLQDSIEHRWAKVKTAVHDLTGVPPIEVYQVGDAYFVIDGNHRVSVAREMGLPTISAYVTEVKTRVPLAADDNPDEIISKARYAEFLEQTNLDKIRPEADLLMTFTGQYRLILEHVAVHRHYLGLEQQRFISEEEAVASWYDNVYVPVIQIVREQGVLRYFPNRTEADIYVLLAEHRAELAEALGWEVSPETAVTQLSKEKRSPIQTLLEAVVPAELGSGPPPGMWRAELVNKRPSGHLFDDMLIPMGTNLADWRALDMGIGIAQLGQSRLLGLHVLDEANPPAEAMPPDAIRAEFEQRCAAAGVQAQFAVEAGSVAAKIVQRSVYTDGIVLPVNHPPETVADRYTSGLQYILRHCPRPILTAPPGPVRPLAHALLAYGGGQTPAEEALFVAAYLAAHYQIRLSVVSVGDKRQTNKARAHVRAYLQQSGVEFKFYTAEGEVEEIVRETAVTTNADFLIVGSFAYGPLRTLLFGGLVNRLLLSFDRPMLICR
jgi:nucleotide-binding universal stress UspA family protein